MSGDRSPFHVRRVEEKQELHHLNSRLENYVLHAKDIAADRDRLVEELASIRREFTIERKQIIERHEIIVTDLREELSEATTSLAASETLCEELQRENRQLKDKLAGMDELRRQRDALAAEVDPLKTEVEELKEELRRLTRSYKELQKESSSQTRSINSLRSRLDSRNEEVKKLQTQLAGFDDKLAAELQAARDASAELLQAAKEEWERMNASKFDRLTRDLKEAHDKESEALRAHNNKLQEQVARLTESIAGLKQELRKKQTYCTELIKRLETFEEESQDSDMADRMRGLEKEISALRTQLRDKEDEFYELMDIKISLEAEIKHYRDILEVEEPRIGLRSPSAEREKVTAEADADSDAGAAAVIKRKKKDKVKKRTKRTLKRSSKMLEVSKSTVVGGGAGAGAGSGSGGRRKVQRTLTRTVTKSSQQMSGSGIDMELDLIADTVRITNETGEKLDLEGWVLTSEVGSNQKFTFPEGIVLEAGESTTVYSGKGADKHQRPPHHLFWTKRYIWNNDGDSATLLNKEGEQVQAVTGEPLALDDVDDALNKGEQDNCTIM